MEQDLHKKILFEILKNYYYYYTRKNTKSRKNDDEMGVHEALHFLKGSNIEIKEPFLDENTNTAFILNPNVIIRFRPSTPDPQPLITFIKENFPKWENSSFLGNPDQVTKDLVFSVLYEESETS